MLKPEQQLPIICKGVENLISKEELMFKLERSYSENRPLIVKLGLDPSAPDIHLGHTVVLRKAKQLQDLGHQIIIVIGDFTGRIGDPTGKSKGRVALSDKQVKENAETYCEQIFKVLDKERTKVVFNSEWLSKLTLEYVIKIASSITVARMLERDDFNSRYKNQIPIGMHEFFYPLMQAQDSVELNADIELGGIDQTFNVLMGRNLQKYLGKEQQITLLLPILVGLDGTEKMSKSLGNYIGVNEPAEVMFKKVMEIPDELIISYYELTTDEHPDRIDKIKHQLEEGVNPRDIKMDLAFIITKLYHGEEKTQEAQKYYTTVFSNKQIPDNILEIIMDEKVTVRDVAAKIVEETILQSKNEFLRLIKQGGVQVNGVKININDVDNVLDNQSILKIGKKIFVRISYSNK